MQIPLSWSISNVWLNINEITRVHSLGEIIILQSSHWKSINQNRDSQVNHSVYTREILQ